MTIDALTKLPVTWHQKSLPSPSHKSSSDHRFPTEHYTNSTPHQSPFSESNQ